MLGARMPRYLTKKMSYVALIKEHKNLVKVLKKGNKQDIKKLVKEQEAELKEYKKEYQRKRK